MLKRLHVRNFTVFEDAEFVFGPGLNVVVGTNGTGKSHVLKLGYAVEVARVTVSRAQHSSYPPSSPFGSFVAWAAGLYSLPSIFQAGQYGRLIRRGTIGAESEVEVSFQTGEELRFEISPKDDAKGLTSSMNISEGGTPTFDTEKIPDPVFIPAKEILTMMPDIIGLSDQYPDLLDATYTSLARKLTIRLLAAPPAAAQPVLQALGAAMGGTIKAESGRFYLQPAAGEAFEIGLVAEGYRKLGTLAYLLGNGTFTKDTTLYWDEPEANLNPALLKQLAGLLAQLAAQGFQIILATHSLFLLKEFHILSRQMPEAQVRYFGLNAQPGKGVAVTATNDLEQLPHIAALDAELDLADRFQEVLDQEDANGN